MNTTHQSVGSSKKIAEAPIRSWADESDESTRLARLEEAVLVMMEGDDETAFRWLHSPLGILDNETPLEHARTGIGAHHVDNLISRRLHGVFS